MRNWKTTLTGVLTIIVAIAAPALEFLKAGVIPDLTATIAAITAGVGLILAKDAAVKE